jgi:hypothetical protein
MQALVAGWGENPATTALVRDRFRGGGEEYEAEHATFGLATIRRSLKRRRWAAPSCWPTGPAAAATT